MYRIMNFCLLLSIAFFATACGSDESSNSNDNSDDDGTLNITINDDDGESSNIQIDLDELENIDLTEAEGKLEEALHALKDAVNDGEKVETMNFRNLKAILPSRLLGMDRTKYSGEKNGAMGISIAQAEAEYEEDDQHLKVTIVDGGGMGIAKIGGMAFDAIEIDKESDDGYERTTKIEGYKAHEKWNSKTGKSELIWMYKDRYIISLKGRGLDGDDLEKARKRIDYEDLD